MTILVFGKTGQVASELGRHPDVLCLGRTEAELADPEACAAAVRALAPRAVINAAAYTNVERAESEEAKATRINADAPGAIARACAALDIPLVQISTDYVFSGQGDAPWQPADRPAPLNAYGRSKLAGEEAVRAAGGRYAILRTSWVFSAHGANFVKTMLRLSETRDKLEIVEDQIGGPTPARAIAAACLSIARHLCQDPNLSGTYHLSGAPDTSWADFAQEVFARAGRTVAITPVPTGAFPTIAKRPLNSRLDCRTLEEVFALHRPDWRAGLDEVLKDLEIAR